MLGFEDRGGQGAAAEDVGFDQGWEIDVEAVEFGEAAAEDDDVRIEDIDGGGQGAADSVFQTGESSG